MELAIDTSSDMAGVALSDGGKAVAECNWRSHQNHTVELMPAVSRLLERAGVGFGELKGVVVARGPGSFNGLRVGISTAKGLALSRGIPLVGVGTLEVEAWPFAAMGLPVCALHGAGRGEIAVAVFRQEGVEWRRLCEDHLTTLARLCEDTREKTVFCGELAPDSVRELASRLGELAVIPDETARMRRASHLAALGWRRLGRGESDSVASLQAIYLRPPPITKPRGDTR